MYISYIQLRCRDGHDQSRKRRSEAGLAAKPLIPFQDDEIALLCILIYVIHGFLNERGLLFSRRLIKLYTKFILY